MRTGSTEVVKYLQESGGLPACATNLNTTSDAELRANEDLVSAYTIVDLGNGKTLALLSLLDARQMEDLPDGSDVRVLSYERALTEALHQLAGLEIRPHVIALIVSDMSAPDLHDLLPRSSGDAHAEAKAVLELAQQFIDLDLVIVAGDLGAKLDDYLDAGPDESSATKVRNWVGKTTWLATTAPQSLRGAAATRLVLDFEAGGDRTCEADVIRFDCNVTEDNETRAAIDALSVLADGALRTSHVGYVTSDLNTAAEYPGRCTKIDNSETCGCARAECAAGNVVADALAWYADTDVALLPSTSLSTTLRAGSIDESNVV